MLSGGGCLLEMEATAHGLDNDYPLLLLLLLLVHSDGDQGGEEEGGGEGGWSRDGKGDALSLPPSFLEGEGFEWKGIKGSNRLARMVLCIGNHVCMGWDGGRWDG